jgi:pyrimidine operon attenuation protein / uracil phosphoribosyltransferase
MTKELTGDQLTRALDHLYTAIHHSLPKDQRVALVGIRTRGDTLARRILKRLSADGIEVDYGVLDITFYRDDLSRRRGAPLVRATDIDFDLDGTWLLLIDDVLQTGRSVRAALDAIHDFGRPAYVRLAVLIDRGGRELPIAADFVGRKVRAPHGTRVQVKLKENDGEEGVFIIRRS